MIGTDESGYGIIDVVSTEDIKTIKNKIYNQQLLRLDVCFDLDIIKTIFAEPLRFTQIYEGGFNLLIRIVGGEGLSGELVLSMKYIDAFICVGQQTVNGEWVL